jgi:plasmid stabilization system protein ParE
VKPVRFAPESVEEFSEAAAWYEMQRPGLAKHFLEELAAAVAAVRARPASFPRLSGMPRDVLVRRALLQRFPYAVLFVELAEAIQVVAVAHLKRDPNYWLNRLEP